jgi:hypothetical protein
MSQPSLQLACEQHMCTTEEDQVELCQAHAGVLADGPGSLLRPACKGVLLASRFMS